MSRRILLLGGHGSLGSHITRMLAATPGFVFLVVGREPHATGLFVEYLLEEGADARAVAAGPLEPILARERPDLVIDATGTVTPDHVAARSCIAAHVPYIDVSDDRATVLGVRRLNAAAVAAGVAALSGAGVAPCLTMAAVARLAADTTDVSAVRVYVERGNGEEYGPASIAGVVARAGRPMTWRRDGRWEAASGLYTLAPRPRMPEVGGRLMAYDVPELDLLPELWPGLREATVWAEIELDVLSWGLRRLGGLARIWPGAPAIPVGLLDMLVRSLGHFGTTRSSIRVELEGRMDGHGVVLSWTLTAGGRAGAWLRAAPAVAMARQVLGGLVLPGARVARLDLAEIMVELRGRDIEVKRSDMNLSA